MQCPYCHVGLCKRHPRQDHGTSTRGIVKDRLGTLSRMMGDMLERKKRQAELERMAEASGGKFSAQVRVVPAWPALWRSAGASPQEFERRYLEASGKKGKSSADAAAVMGLKPVSDSSDSESESSR